MSAPVTEMAECRVPRWSATTRWLSDSSNDASSNWTEKVRTWCGERSVASLVTMDESSRR